MRAAAFVVLALAAACSSSAPAQPTAHIPTAPPPHAAADAAAPASCEDLCTTFATCWEEQYKKDFTRGGDCTDDCESKTPADRAEWAAKVEHARENSCSELFE